MAFRTHRRHRTAEREKHADLEPRSRSRTGDHHKRRGLRQPVVRCLNVPADYLVASAQLLSTRLAPVVYSTAPHIITALEQGTMLIEVR